MFGLAFHVYWIILLRHSIHTEHMQEVALIHAPAAAALHMPAGQHVRARQKRGATAANAAEETLGPRNLTLL